MSDNGRNKPAPSGVWKIGSNAYKISSFFWAKLRVVVKSLNSWGKLPGLECRFTIDSEGPQFPSLQTAVITVPSWEERNSGCWVVKEDLREPPNQSLSRPCHNGIWWSSHTKDCPRSVHGNHWDLCHLSPPICPPGRCILLMCPKYGKEWNLKISHEGISPRAPIMRGASV